MTASAPAAADASHISIRDATANDFSAILSLNAESEHFLSRLDADSLWRLHAQAVRHRVVDVEGTLAAFLLALREGADYDSPNYRWFVQHRARFLYIDRVVVAAAWQGRRLGALLYDDIIAFAAASGVAELTCEFDLQPLNPASARFHARYGFREVGRQWLGGGRKQVSLQALRIESGRA